MTGMETAERLTAKAVAGVMRTLFPDAEPDVRCVLMQTLRGQIIPAVVTAMTVARKGRRKVKVGRIDLTPSDN